jgi:hypothetical protein
MKAADPSRRLRTPGHATIVAYLALFLALGGGVAWAAATIGSDDIKNDAIRSRHILNREVNGADVGDGSLTGADVLADTLTIADVDDTSLFNDNSLTGADINEGTLGQVPSAAGASSASNAQLLAGHPPSDLVFNRAGFRTVLRPTSVSLSPGGQPALFGLGDVLLEIECNSGPDLEALVLTASSADTMVRSATLPSADNDERYAEDDVFRNGEEFDLLPETSTEHDDNTQGTFTYFDPTVGDRHLVTGTFFAEETASKCIFGGMAAEAS